MSPEVVFSSILISPYVYDAGVKTQQAKVPERKVSKSCDPRKVKGILAKYWEYGGVNKHDQQIPLCRFALPLEVGTGKVANDGKLGIPHVAIGRLITNLRAVAVNISDNRRNTVSAATEESFPCCDWPIVAESQEIIT